MEGGWRHAAAPQVVSVNVVMSHGDFTLSLQFVLRLIRRSGDSQEQSAIFLSSPWKQSPTLSGDLVSALLDTESSWRLDGVR